MGAEHPEVLVFIKAWWVQINCLALVQIWVPVPMNPKVKQSKLIESLDSCSWMSMRCPKSLFPIQIILGIWLQVQVLPGSLIPGWKCGSGFTKSCASFMDSSIAAVHAEMESMSVLLSSRLKRHFFISTISSRMLDIILFTSVLFKHRSFCSPRIGPDSFDIHASDVEKETNKKYMMIILRLPHSARSSLELVEGEECDTGKLGTGFTGFTGFNFLPEIGCNRESLFRALTNSINNLYYLYQQIFIMPST